MSEGHVQSACCGDLRGFGAFAAMITRFDARVVLGQDDSNVVDADLAAHWQVLILEAMRRSDERERRASFSAPHDPPTVTVAVRSPSASNCRNLRPGLSPAPHPSLCYQ